MAWYTDHSCHRKNKTVGSLVVTVWTQICHHCSYGWIDSQKMFLQKRTAGDDGEDVAPEAVRLEAKLLQHALAADAQRRQHGAVQRAGEEERRWRPVELIDLQSASEGSQ